MIRIKPYTSLPERKEIEELYLELVARTLPFREEDLSGDPALFPEKLFDREKSAAKKPPTARESRTIIQDYSEELHSFLFDETGKLKRERLHSLLFSPMDEQSRAERKLCFARGGDPGEMQRVFSYERFSSSAKIHEFVRLLKVPVCPYCNRSFTTTLVRGRESRISTRPELDHYLPKNRYPHFALSILNLVPSCGTCNRLKSNRDERILYPYAEGMGDRFRFETKPKGDMSYLIGAGVDFELRLSPCGSLEAGFRERAENSERLLGLTELYQGAHRDFVSELFFRRYVFTDELLEELLEQFGEKDGGLFESVDDIKRLLFLRGLREEEWGERPLSKLAHDIDREITALEAAKKRENRSKSKAPPEK